MEKKKHKVIEQLRIAFKESEYMFYTLMKSQTEYWDKLKLYPNSNISVYEQIEKAKSDLLIRYEFLSLFSYHYVYDLNSINEILIRSLKQELINFKDEISAFLNTKLVQEIKSIKDNRTHQKRSNFITFTYWVDNFKEKFSLGNLRVMCVGKTYRQYIPTHEIKDVTLEKIISSKDFININMNTNSLSRDLSTLEFLQLIVFYRCCYLKFFKQQFGIELILD